MLVLDVGTTGVKAFVFNGNGTILSKAYSALGKTRPQKGWVEQDPYEILVSSMTVMRQAVQESRIPLERISGFGITNQREATVVWDKDTGSSVYPVIGWEDSRTKAFCTKIAKKESTQVRERTGLPIESYFSASKVRWILDNVPNTRKLEKEGRLAFGTLDSWLLYHLCENHPHVTDETNASRTLLFNIRTRQWDESLLELFDVPKSILPVVQPSSSKFGVLSEAILGVRLPVLAVCGDQQSSLYAASCTEGVGRYATKITYGTGSFVMQNIGKRFLLGDAFFTTLVPGTDGSDFAVEMKVEGTGEAVAKVVDNSDTLKKYLKTLAKHVDRHLKLLPHTPPLIIADGGVARDNIVVEFQQSISHIPVRLQQTYDGTALGVALMIFNSSLEVIS